MVVGCRKRHRSKGYQEMETGVSKSLKGRQNSQSSIVLKKLMMMKMMMMKMMMVVVIMITIILHNVLKMFKYLFENFLQLAAKTHRRKIE